MVAPTEATPIDLSASRSDGIASSATWRPAAWPSSTSRARRRWAASRRRSSSRSSSRSYAENPRVVQMFLDEARLAAKLNHQSIVHVYDVAEDDGLKYIAMEYIRGETLTEIVKHGLAARKLPAARARRARRAADGGGAGLRARLPRARRPPRAHRPPRRLAHEHPRHDRGADEDRRLRHRARAGRAARGDRASSGKASYMSPEQVRGETADTARTSSRSASSSTSSTLGQRLFRGPAEAVMKRIVEREGRAAHGGPPRLSRRRSS